MKVDYCKACFYYNEIIIRVKIENNDDIPLFNLKVSKCNGNYKREPLRKCYKMLFIRMLRIGLVNRKRVKICYFHCTEIHKIKYCFEKKPKIDEKVDTLSVVLKELLHNLYGKTPREIIELEKKLDGGEQKKEQDLKPLNSFCVNCGKKDSEFICLECNENTIKTYEKQQEQKDIVEFLDFLYEHRNSISDLGIMSHSLRITMDGLDKEIDDWETRKND